MYYNGWYQVAFERDIRQDLTPVQVGETRLVLVKGPDGLECYDAICPHRGANLAFGGCVEDGVIVCPFHGYHIGLDQPGEFNFSVSKYPTLLVGGLIFVLVGKDMEKGLSALLGELDKAHYFVPGFEMKAQVNAEMVIENAFDEKHFKPRHKIRNDPRFFVRAGDYGELQVEGTFEVPPSAWQKSRTGQSTLEVPFVARAFSPYLVISEMGGDNPYWVITAASPVGPLECTIRLSLILPPTSTGKAPDRELCQYLLQQSKAGLEMDKLIWENMSHPAASHFTPADAAVIEFRKFCRQFRGGLAALKSGQENGL